MANSNVEACINSTNATKVTGGTQLLGGYSQAQKGGEVTINSPPDFSLGTKIDGSRDILVLCVQRLSGASESFYASLGYHEES